MKELNKWQAITFQIGAVLLLAGAIGTVFEWQLSPYVFGVGAIFYTIIQMMQTYEGRNFTIRRLRRIMLFSDLLLLLSAVLLFATYGKVPFIDQITYAQYIHNNWVVVLLLAAILQLYTTVRIDNELIK
ncbi:MAG: hypothetical protein K6D91_04565 [Prevotella sp.]|nr:hypothetical protein [Prevotella sp.]